jgi:hypothetical protein
MKRHIEKEGDRENRDALSKRHTDQKMEIQIDTQIKRFASKKHTVKRYTVKNRSQIYTLTHPHTHTPTNTHKET